MLLASRNSTCFRNRTFWFWNIISTIFYCSKWRSHDSIFDFHTVMYIDGSSNAKTECRCNVGVLYFRFTVALLTKQKRISQKKNKKNAQSFNLRPFGLWFSCKFFHGKCFLSYSGTCVICLWGVSFWEIYENKNYAFPLGPLLATFIMLLSIIHLNNGFSFDEASYSEIFRMWLERLFSL